MIAPPTDRLHKFLAIAGTALFIFGVTLPIDRYDQSVRQFIEAKARAMELGDAQMRMSIFLDEANKALQSEIEAIKARGAGAAKPNAAVDLARLDVEVAKHQREIAELSVQAQKHLSLAEHSEKLKSIWLVIGSACVLTGLLLAVLGFTMWWRQPADQR